MLEKRLQEVERQLQELSQLLKFKTNDYLQEVWLDSADIKQLFHFSDSKLYRLRKTNGIPHKLVGGTYLYPKSYFTQTLLEAIKNREKLE